MHGHVHAVGGQGFQAQTMVGLEKAAALRQAEAVRRSLLRAAARELDGDLDDEGREMVEAWAHGEGNYPGGRRKAYGATGGSEPAQPSGVSYWV
jgi:hypothetical protein